MKGTSVVSFLITLFLAGAVCIQGQAVQVNDTNGHPVQRGEQYYILPVNHTNGKTGDGLVPVPVILDPFCPFGISQGLFLESQGLPVSFEYPYAPETIIKTYRDVIIEFKINSSFCTESKFWEVDETLTSPTEFAVIVGGKPEKQNSWFRIKEDGKGKGTNTYKLTTCSTPGTVKSIPRPWSSAYSLYFTNNAEFKTLLVKFQKVDDPTTATTSTHAKV